MCVWWYEIMDIKKGMLYYVKICIGTTAPLTWLPCKFSSRRYLVGNCTSLPCTSLNTSSISSAETRFGFAMWPAGMRVGSGTNRLCSSNVPTGMRKHWSDTNRHPPSRWTYSQTYQCHRAHSETDDGRSGYFELQVGASSCSKSRRLAGPWQWYQQSRCFRHSFWEMRKGCLVLPLSLASLIHGAFACFA